MSGECEKCGDYAEDCECIEEEELEPDFTWKLYRTHLLEEVIHFEGSISINRFMNILTLLKDEGYDHIFCKFPIDIT